MNSLYNQIKRNIEIAEQFEEKIEFDLEKRIKLAINKRFGFDGENIVDYVLSNPSVLNGEVSSILGKSLTDSFVDACKKIKSSETLEGLQKSVDLFDSSIYKESKNNSYEEALTTKEKKFLENRDRFYKESSSFQEGEHVLACKGLSKVKLDTELASYGLLHATKSYRGDSIIEYNIKVRALKAISKGEDATPIEKSAFAHCLLKYLHDNVINSMNHRFLWLIYPEGRGMIKVVEPKRWFDLWNSLERDFGYRDTIPNYATKIVKLENRTPQYLEAPKN